MFPGYDLGETTQRIADGVFREIMETLYAPVEAKVFFMHTDPLTYADTALFKLV